MYHKIGIQKLSPTQISKLLNGHKIRVKHGQGMEIHASQEQHKKIMSAHKKGKAHTMQFDPYQMAQHQHLRGKKGKGVFEDFAGAIIDPIKNVGHDVGRAFAPIPELNPFDLGYTLGHDVIAPALVGKGIARGRTTARAPVARGRGLSTRGRVPVAKRGRGAKEIAMAGAKALAPIAIDEGAKAVKSLFGLGTARGRTTARAPVARGRGVTTRGRPKTTRGRGKATSFKQEEMAEGHMFYPAVMPSGGALYQAGYGMDGSGKKKVGRPKKGKGALGDFLGSMIPI
jgi:hypothetical protein